MKKTAIKLLTLCLAACLLLTACGGAKTTVFSYEGLTVEVPRNYKQITGAEVDAYTFALANSKASMMGIREEKAIFEAYGLDPTLEEYANMVQAANQKEMDMSTYNGQIMMNFTSTVNGETYEYLASVYESEDAYWVIQCGCRSKDYEKYRGDFFSQLLSVKP
ncbi:MAG: hypothetical protein IKL30_06455 [Anaerotignum sp.]|nr:hypothetical protein [Anaerotignum sp.]